MHICTLLMYIRPCTIPAWKNIYTRFLRHQSNSWQEQTLPSSRCKLLGSKQAMEATPRTQQSFKGSHMHLENNYARLSKSTSTILRRHMRGSRCLLYMALRRRLQGPITALVPAGHL